MKSLPFIPLFLLQYNQGPTIKSESQVVSWNNLFMNKCIYEKHSEEPFTSLEQPVAVVISRLLYLMRFV